ESCGRRPGVAALVGRSQSRRAPRVSALDTSQREASAPEEPTADTGGTGTAWSLVRLGLGLIAALGLVLVLARTLKPEVEHLGRALVDHGGYVGMALGSLIADGFHFPIPPQFYMLLAIASAT